MLVGFDKHLISRARYLESGLLSDQLAMGVKLAPQEMASNIENTLHLAEDAAEVFEVLQHKALQDHLVLSRRKGQPSGEVVMLEADAPATGTPSGPSKHALREI
jgi:hypothetical protein